MSKSATADFDPALRPSIRLALGHVHDHPGEEVKPRLDRIEIDVLGVVGMRTETAQPESLDNSRLRPQRRECRIGAAAVRDVADVKRIAPNLAGELARSILLLFCDPRCARAQSPSFNPPQLAPRHGPSSVT